MIMMHDNYTIKGIDLFTDLASMHSALNLLIIGILFFFLTSKYRNLKPFIFRSRSSNVT